MSKCRLEVSPWRNMAHLQKGYNDLKKVNTELIEVLKAVVPFLVMPPGKMYITDGEHWTFNGQYISQIISQAEAAIAKAEGAEGRAQG